MTFQEAIAALRIETPDGDGGPCRSDHVARAAFDAIEALREELLSEISRLDCGLRTSRISSAQEASS